MERKRPLGLYRQCVREEADPSHADFHLGLSAVSARTLLNPKRHCFSESSKNLAFFSTVSIPKCICGDCIFFSCIWLHSEIYNVRRALLLLLNHKCCSSLWWPLLPPLQSLFLRADQDAIFDFFSL